MDRFKIRAWHNGVMYNVDTLGLEDKGICPTMSFAHAERNGSIPNKDCVCFNPSTIFMQCTGLKDNNGTLTYEGDIVRAWGGESHNCFWEVDIKGVIEYSSSASFDLVTKDKINYSFGYSAFEGIEIIGNIYQNPELS